MSDGLGDYRSRVPTPEELEARKTGQVPKGLRKLLSPRRKLRVAYHVAAEDRATSQSSPPRPRASLAPVFPAIGPGTPPRCPTDEEIERAVRFRKQREADAIPSSQPQVETQTSGPSNRSDTAIVHRQPRTRGKVSISNEVRRARGSGSTETGDQISEDDWQSKWPKGLSMEEIHRRIGAQQSYLDDID